MKIELIQENKKQYLDLLLLADESEDMIDKYLHKGDLFALYDGDLKSVCVVAPIDSETCELKNIATYPQYQGKGYGTALINHVSELYKNKYKYMLVGTGEVPSILAFYQSFGFKESHRIKNFFTDNYPHPMFEGDIQLVDMIYLKKELKTNKLMRVISVREHPEIKDQAISYFQSKWKSVLPIIYEDCINHTIGSPAPLPQWYLLEKEGEIIGCAGLITNDFISRMDLWPWVAAVYIEEDHRGNNYASLLIDKAKTDTKEAGFKHLYLCTDHIGYYEKFGFAYIGQGYHPWGEESRIYQFNIED